MPPTPDKVLKRIAELEAAGLTDGPEWFNTWADYWRYVIGINIIPADARKKGTENAKIIRDSWTPWQTEPIPDEVHEGWKTEGLFYQKRGMGIVTGTVWHNDQAPSKVLSAIDMDNAKAIQEFCTRDNILKPLSILAEKTIIEQHLDNPTKAHLIMYMDRPLVNKGSDNKGPLADKLNANDLPAFEIMGSRRLIFVSPSIHKDGHPYQIIGTRKPEVSYRANEIEQHIDGICRKYGIKYLENADGKGSSKIPREELFKEDFKIYENHNRSEALMRVMEIFLQKEFLSHTQIRKIAREWNEEHCVPPLGDAKFEEQWKCALDFVAKLKAQDNNNYNSSNTSKYQFSSEISQQLEGHIYKITRPGPPIRMTLADMHQQKIFSVTIPVVKNRSSEQNTTDGTSTTKTQLQVSKTLHYDDLIIDAIPDKIKIYDNPVDTSAPRRYQITWNTRSSLPSKKGVFITGPGSIESTLQELENKNMIIKKLSARDALAAIISAIETEGDEQKIEIDETVETSGYYLINGKFVTRNITQQMDKEPDKNSVLECIEFLDALSTKWKDLTKFPTMIKWAVLSPFDYILKNSTKDSNSSKWLPLIHMHNWSSSGKSSLGKIALAIWRKHGTLDKKDHQIGFSNIDTEARFGTVISKTTYPILVNEVGALSAQGDRYQWLVELIKIAVESPNTRGKYMEKRYTSIPALSALIFTSNPKPPKDSGYRTRAIIMHFSKNEVHPRGSDEAVEFEKYLNSKLHLLGVLGDFVAREFIEKYKDNAEESPLFSPNKSFDEISKDIISAFYKLAGKDKPPEWLDRLTQQANVVEDHTEEAYLELRSFLIKEITDAYSRHNKALYNSKTDPDPSLNIVDMSTRLDFCLKNTLVPFLHLKDFESSEVLITADIFLAMERAGKKIEGLVTLEDLKNELGESFQHNSAKIGGQKRKVIRGTRGDFTNFLQGKVGDIIND
jgi:hypothetical protein